jgi:hypothetical protein
MQLVAWTQVCTEIVWKFASTPNYVCDDAMVSHFFYAEYDAYAKAETTLLAYDIVPSSRTVRVFASTVVTLRHMPDHKHAAASWIASLSLLAIVALVLDMDVLQVE